MNIDTLSMPQTRTASLMRNVYLWMTLGLAFTGVIASVIGNMYPELALSMVKSGTIWVAVIAEFALVFALSLFIGKMSAPAAVACFLVYAALNGVTLSIIFIAYTGITIAKAFFVAAGMFGGLALVGTFTKKDLSKFGGIMMGMLIGLIIATIVNMFMRSSAFDLILSYATVAIFCGLTAWDAQKIKLMNENMGSNISEGDFRKLSIMGALTLYLDFINIFLALLRIFGRRN